MSSWVIESILLVCCCLLHDSYSCPILTCCLLGSVGGTYAQYALSNSSTVFTLPDHISFDQGAAINVPYRTAYIALFRVCSRLTLVLC